MVSLAPATTTKLAYTGQVVICWPSPCDSLPSASSQSAVLRRSASPRRPRRRPTPTTQYEPLVQPGIDSGQSQPIETVEQQLWAITNIQCCCWLLTVGSWQCVLLLLFITRSPVCPVSPVWECRGVGGGWTLLLQHLTSPWYLGLEGWSEAASPSPASRPPSQPP